jgi:hypothetical protein
LNRNTGPRKTFLIPSARLRDTDSNITRSPVSLKIFVRFLYVDRRERFSLDSEVLNYIGPKKIIIAHHSLTLSPLRPVKYRSCKTILYFRSVTLNFRPQKIFIICKVTSNYGSKNTYNTLKFTVPRCVVTKSKFANTRPNTI